MISLLAFAFAQMLAPAAAAQPVMSSHSDDEPKPVVSGSDTCLPMKLADGLPVISGRLGGRSITLAFDTGSPGGPLLSPAVIRDLKLPKVGEAQVTDPSMKNVLTVGLYGLANLSIGNVKIEQWTAIEHSAKESRRLAEPDGIIGLTAFAGFVVTIDYPGRRILLTKGRLPEPDGRSIFHYEGPIPRVPLSIEGHPIDAHLDTGNARYGLIVPEKYAASLANYSRSFAIGIARTVNNQFDLKAVPVSDAKVGDFPLYAGTAAFPSAGARANVGSEILKDMVVMIDPANAIVALKRAPSGLENGCPAT